MANYLNASLSMVILPPANAKLLVCNSLVPSGATLFMQSDFIRCISLAAELKKGRQKGLTELQTSLDGLVSFGFNAPTAGPVASWLIQIAIKKPSSGPRAVILNFFFLRPRFFSSRQRIPAR